MSEETGLFAPGLSGEEAPRPPIMGGKKRKSRAPAPGQAEQDAADASASSSPAPQNWGGGASSPAPPVLGAGGASLRAGGASLRAGGASLEQGRASGPEGKSGGGEEAKRGKLRLTNGYDVNFDQLARLLGIACQDARPNIPPTELAAAVGVSDNHGNFLRHIAAALGLVRTKTMKPTELGRLIAAQDTFFDDIGTLWFLHYVIASEPDYIVWNYFANAVMPKKRAFGLKDFRNTLEEKRYLFASKAFTGYVNKETLSVLDAYTNQQFSRLAYLKEQEGGYGLGYRQPVPLLVLAAGITRFRDRHQPANTAVSVSDLLAAPNSPGVVFQMTEDTLRAGLEKLRNGHGFSLETRGDLDQLRFAEDIPEHVRMERYYAER